MNRLVAFGLLIGLVLVGSCDETEPTTFFTLRVDQSYAFYESLDFWVFANDVDGNVLDAQPFEAGDVISLRSEKHVDIFSLSIFAKYRSGGKDAYGVQTFFGVTRNTEMERSRTPSTPRGSAGVATITISNYQESSSPLTSLYFSDGFQSAGMNNSTLSSTYENNTFIMDVILSEGAPELYITGYRGAAPVYEHASNLAAGQSRVFDYNNFKPFDHTFEIKPGEVASLYAYKEINNVTAEFILSSTDNWRGAAALPKIIGYNDGYDNYLTIVRRFENGRNISYEKKGAVNPDVELPDFTFNITNKDLYNFNMEFSRSYTYLTVSWDIDKGTYFVGWSARAKTAEEIVPVKLPPALTELFPQMTFSGLKYRLAEVTECLDGFTYEQYIRQINPAGRSSYERYIYENYQP